MQQRPKGQLTECIQLCLQSMEICKALLESNALDQGETLSQEQVSKLNECANTCATAVDFMRRDSALSASYCALCAIICDECATALTGLSGATTANIVCAAICRTCARSCQAVASMRYAA